MAENNEASVRRDASTKDDDGDADVANIAYKDADDAPPDEEDEDASHKRKYANDDELRSDVSPVRKKLFSKTEEQQYVHTRTLCSL